MTAMSPSATVRVLVYAPGSDPREAELAGDPTAAIGKLVGGYVESLGIDGQLAIFYNEAGNDGTLPPNVLGIYGTFVVVAREAPEVIRSLTDDEVALARRFVERNATADLRH